LEDCTLQVSPSGHYLDLDLSLLEQKDDLEGFYEEVRKGRRPTLILRTQLSVRVHAIIEKLYNSQGPELRRSLFSLKQLFQEDKDLVPEFVNLDGLSCLIKVGAEADQNYQNYILRALSQIMLFVDGMQGVINHNETIQWLYTLSGSPVRPRTMGRGKGERASKRIQPGAPGHLLGTHSSAPAPPGSSSSSSLPTLGLSSSAHSFLSFLLQAAPHCPCLVSARAPRCSLPAGCSGDAAGMLRGETHPWWHRHPGDKPGGSGGETHPVPGQEGTCWGSAGSPWTLGREDAPPLHGDKPVLRRFDLQLRWGCSVPVPILRWLHLSLQGLEDAGSPSGPQRGVEGAGGFCAVGLAVQCGVAWFAGCPRCPHPRLVASQQPPLVSHRTRFLENLAAAQKEKMASMAKGRLNVLSDAALEHPPPLAWDRDSSTPESGMETPNLSRCCQGVIDAESQTQKLENTGMMPIKKEVELTWENLEASPVQLKIKDLDFTDLGEEDDFDILDSGPMANGSFLPSSIEATSAGALMVPSPPAAPGCPPPPPPLPAAPGCPPPPPPPVPGCPPPPPIPRCPPPPGLPSPSTTDGPSQAKKKRTVKLFWKELKQLDGTLGPGRFGQETLWASLQNVEVNAAKLEHLFESRSKEATTSKKANDGKKVVVVLDPKRSNAINIGLTVLPPVHIIKTAVLNFDEFAVNKEGIEKILTMVPTEEEKQKIQEAQLANPDVPLGSAEQFLLALSSISDLTARLQLWAFKLDYESLEQEIAEPLYDLKVGMEQLARNHTFKCILATLLAMGNFLNGSQSRGFELGYLEKVSEVKDTVHRQSLLHHLCQMVVEKFPETTDLYSEIASITRSAKVDFEELANSLVQLERRCRASWDNLKVIAKHETKAVLKSKLKDFLKDSTQRIVVLKVVHRRVLNRFHSFLLYLGYPRSVAQEVKVTSICKLLREFALEYRTCRERVLQQQRKRDTHRQRNKTRGRLITETEKFSNITEAAAPPALVSSGPEEQMEAGHESMKSLLTSPTDAPARRSRASRGTGQASPAQGSPAQEDVPSSPDDASDEIMDRLVKSVTHSANPRPCPNKERRRSRGNRKSRESHPCPLALGLSDELVQALGLGQAPGME
ncbi:FH1/FH2 domain-containing protein 1, partial [Calypte anna]